jgi:hypothetical protein
MLERERERDATIKAVILLRKVRNSIMNYAVNLMEKNLGKNNDFSPILLFVSM